MTAVRAQGVPTVIGYMHGLSSLPAKAKSDSKKYGNRFFETEFGTDTKIVEESSEAGSGALLRIIASMKSKELTYRSNRSYMVRKCLFILMLYSMHYLLHTFICLI
jgi:pre-rRNA-processing protein TSR1